MRSPQGAWIGLLGIVAVIVVGPSRAMAAPPSEASDAPGAEALSYRAHLASALASYRMEDVWR